LTAAAAAAAAAGRDVASGSYRIIAVQMAFSKAARRLESLAQSNRGSGNGRINYLEGLFDVARALDRQGHRRGGWGPAAGAAGKLVDDYFVINQGGRFVVRLGSFVVWFAEGMTCCYSMLLRRLRFTDGQTKM
jgi:hypothetical protein